MQQSVEHILKLIKHLHLIKQYIIRLVVDNPALHVGIELVGIAKFLESVIIESHFHDMVVRHSIILKKPSEQSEQQERFAATPHSCNNLHQSVMPTTDQFLQIFISLYNHSLQKIFADIRTFLR